MSSDPYKVDYGWCHENWRTFATFADAIAFYKSVAWQEHGAGIINSDGYDCDCDEDGYCCISDGLSEEETERVELADAVVYRYRRLRDRAFGLLIETGVALFRARAWSIEELEALAAIEVARKRQPKLVEQALDVAECRVRDLERAGLWPNTRS